MGRQLWFPTREDWYTDSIEDAEYDKVSGGYAIISQGRQNHPVIVVYGLEVGNDSYNVQVLEQILTEDYKGDKGTIPATLATIAYDMDAVLNSVDEEYCVMMANEYQGGEADCVEDIAYGKFVQDAEDVRCIHVGVIPANLDDHDAVIAYIVEHISEWIDASMGA